VPKNRDLEADLRSPSATYEQVDDCSWLFLSSTSSLQDFQGQEFFSLAKRLMLRSAGVMSMAVSLLGSCLGCALVSPGFLVPALWLALVCALALAGLSLMTRGSAWLLSELEWTSLRRLRTACRGLARIDLSGA